MQSPAAAAAVNMAGFPSSSVPSCGTCSSATGFLVGQGLLIIDFSKDNIWGSNIAMKYGGSQFLGVGKLLSYCCPDVLCLHRGILTSRR